MSSLTPLPLPAGVRTRHVPDVRGLDMHVLEAGTPDQPLVVLLHGFPEIAFSWRNVMPLLAAAGYRTVAPDQRGFGRTTGWSADYQTSLEPYKSVHLAEDILSLLDAIGETEAHAVVGHDFGASVAATLALLAPHRFARLALMSAPFAGVPQPNREAPVLAIAAALAELSPPRKHYHHYYSMPETDREMRHPPQGLHDFLRAYFHHKSGDWAGNTPHPLSGWTAEVLAELPSYYVMGLQDTMPQAVGPFLPRQDEIDNCAWLPNRDLAVYTSEYQRTGFQGGLNWYRARLAGPGPAEHARVADRTIDIPTCFIAGARDWGVYQTPGALEAMRAHACKDMRGVHLIDDAGHWVQQEAPEAVVNQLVSLLR